MDADRYLVECAADVADKIESIYKEILDWISDKGNDHGLWFAYPHTSDCDAIRDPNGRDGVAYGIEEVLDWLNQKYDCGAKIIDTEKTGIHHLDEFDEWLRAHGQEAANVRFIQTLEEYNKFSGTDFRDWSEVLASAEPVSDDYHSPFERFAEFERETGLAPRILKMHYDSGLKVIYF
jgi:hypothetical protein